MTIYDISLTLSNALPVWPGDPPINLYRVLDMSQGDLYTVSRLECGVHTGTHLDAPMHFIRDGRGVDTLDLNVLVGPCEVVYAPDAKVIDAALLDQLHLPAGTTRVLFRTRNSESWARGETSFQTDFVAIDQSGAEWLVAHGLQLVGIDYLSVAPFTASVPTHEVLLQAGVIPIEGLNLSNIEPGEYQLVCLPIKLWNTDGAPVRAILMRDDQGQHRS
ncbi:MAG TPA: cyclase family protein [Anaerolineae bacterium]